MKVLITGITGFVGSHLAHHLLGQQPCDILGTYRSEVWLHRLAGIAERLTLFRQDVRDTEAVCRLIATKQPDAVYHLAGQSSPTTSFGQPAETMTANILGLLSILEAVKSAHLTTARVLVVVSSDVYGPVAPSDNPVDENAPFRPVSPYAVSKVAQDYLAGQYQLVHELDVVRVRPFNHIGPGQRPGFVVSDFAKQIAEIERGTVEPVMYVGNLGVKRDFTDVRDIVNAYRIALRRGKTGEAYNIGSGVSTRLSDLLETLLSLSTASIAVRVAPDKLRAADAPDVVCDPSKFRKTTAWKPVIPLEQTLQDVLNYWRRTVGRTGRSGR